MMQFVIGLTHDGRWSWYLDNDARVVVRSIRPESSRAAAVESARIFARNVAAAAKELDTEPAEAPADA